MGEHMLTLARELGSRFAVTIGSPGEGEGAALLMRAAHLGLRIKALDNAHPGEVTAWLRRSGASLIHVHAGIGWEGHSLVRAGKAVGLPVLRTEHLPYLLTDPVQAAEYRAMLLSVDRRVAVSQAVYRTFAEQGGGKLTLVRNGISEQRGRPLAVEERQAMGLSEGDKLLLTVARFTQQKGHTVLLDALREVLAHQPNVKLLLVGQGIEQDAVEGQIRETGLSDTVKLLGQRSDVPDLLASADLFVLPSHFEGLPLALLEAMAAVVPVVATSIGGTIEAVGASHPYLAPPRDSGALALTILEALGDPVRARQVADASRTRFLDQFSAARMAAETTAVYDLLLNKQGTSP